MFTQDFIDFIKLLNKHQVKYMVVGGYLKRIRINNKSSLHANNAPGH